MNTTIGIAKINWRNSKTSYLITGIVFAMGIVQYIIDFVINNVESDTLSAGNYLYLLPLCMGIFVPARNFSKLMSLGGKRIDFFKSGLLTYAPAAAAACLASMLTRLSIDRWLVSTGRIAGTVDLLDVFGFTSRGPVVAFLQTTVFLLLAACTAHTLTLIQGRWYGWLTNALIIAVISVFTPIAPLRAALVWFFNLIIFHDYAIVQIASCLVFGALIYGVSLIPIKSRVF
jgi:hypothetical protein